MSNLQNYSTKPTIETEPTDRRDYELCKIFSQNNPLSEHNYQTPKTTDQNNCRTTRYIHKRNLTRIDNSSVNNEVYVKSHRRHCSIEVTENIFVTPTKKNLKKLSMSFKLNKAAMSEEVKKLSSISRKRTVYDI